MPRKYRTDPESMGLHRLGHAELANNGQRCGTCDWAFGQGDKALCGCPCSLGRQVETFWRACIHYEPRTRDDHAAHLYRPETK